MNKTSKFNEKVVNRNLKGQFTTLKFKSELDILRTNIVAEVRRKESLWRQLRQRDEEIAALKAKLTNFAIIDSYSSKF